MNITDQEVHDYYFQLMYGMSPSQHRTLLCYLFGLLEHRDEDQMYLFSKIQEMTD